MKDFHVHSTYSDGSFLPAMVSAAERAGLDGIGFADHCDVSERQRRSDARARYGFALDLTYERRRRALEQLRSESDIELYDAVELNYALRDENEIQTFLREADFEYAIGSVHMVNGRSIQSTSAFDGASDSELDAVVDEYFDRLCALIESELFDIAAHLDLIERTPPLRGRATTAHYHRVADALAGSRTVPEINAGRALREGGSLHPNEQFLAILREYEIPMTVGTDAHRPREIGDRATFLRELLDGRGIEVIDPPGL